MILTITVGEEVIGQAMRDMTTTEKSTRVAEDMMIIDKDPLVMIDMGREEQKILDIGLEIDTKMNIIEDLIAETM